MLQTLWGPHREKNGTYETLLAKDDWFSTAGVFYWPTLCQKESNNTACHQNAGSWKHSKTTTKVQVIKDKMERPQFIYD